MEKPCKRPRLSLADDPEDPPDDADLERARAQNDLRLKSIFEEIFKKYGKDFTDVGDEIDLSTGKIVVDNGHISRMRGEYDAGNIALWDLKADVCPSDGRRPNGVSVENITQDTNSGSAINLPDNTGNQATSGFTLNAGFEAAESGPNAKEIPPERQGEGAYGDADDDDKASVDSLLDTAFSVYQDPQHAAEHVMDADDGSTAFRKTLISSIPRYSRENEHAQVDPIWHVPEVPERFSTPASAKQPSKPVHTLNTARSASPPGVGSLWAPPSERRANTNVSKKRGRKSALSEQPRRIDYSSPVVQDWKFAEPPDGSESDDPLQEEYHASPTPKKPLHVGGKRTAPADLYYCSYCRTSFSRREYILHLESVLSSYDENSSHDPTGVQEMLALMNNPGSEHRSTAIDPPVSMANKAAYESNYGSARGQSSAKSNKRFRMTPDEARLIINMKHIQQKKWKEILYFLPGKSLSGLIVWNKLHWNDRLLNPPRHSKPWSEAEREKLNSLKDKQGLTWSTVRNEFPGRTHAELEFELLRLWAGGQIGSCN